MQNDPPTVLCRLEDIPDGEARGFDIDRPEEIVEFLVVRRGGHVFGYRNSCPHIGTPLNWVEDDYMPTCSGAFWTKFAFSAFSEAVGHSL